MSGDGPETGQASASHAVGLEVSKLNLSFNVRGQTLQVLQDCSLDAEAGEFVAILGPSGCGKSTLLRVIHGLQKPDSGGVRIGGEDVREPSRHVGFVFQQYNLFPWRTVLANVEFGLENIRVPGKARKERARQWLGVVGLSEFEGHYPAQLSGGMQQRVNLARALAIEPSVLLMDEPFGSLDAQTRMLLQEELLKIWERDQRTVIFVTHDIDEALFLADRVLVMSPRPGRVLKNVRVDFPRPRDNSIRGDSAFAAMKNDLWTALRAANLGVEPAQAAHDGGAP